MAQSDAVRMRWYMYAAKMTLAERLDRREDVLHHQVQSQHASRAKMGKKGEKREMSPPGTTLACGSVSKAELYKEGSLEASLSGRSSCSMDID